MSVRPVLRMGDPRLLQVSAPVSRFQVAELNELIRDMEDTMRAERGSGLAAVQIGVPLRVVLFGYGFNPNFPASEAVPMTVLINPEIEPLGPDRESAWEGCLSVPGMRGLVPRYTHIVYRGFDPEGRPFECDASGYHARVVQHECDHLDGILYPTRIDDLSQFGFVDELEAAGRLAGGTLPCDDTCSGGRGGK